MNGNDLVCMIDACHKRNCEIEIVSSEGKLKIVGVDVSGDKITLKVER